MTPSDNLRIDADRLWNSIHDIAKIGPGVAGGSNRQTATDEDGEARNLFAGWCRDAGLTMGVDQMGTMFMRREGTDPDLPPVYVGSHLDTQPTGGRYDGVLGVLAGLEIVRTLNDFDIKTRHPIVVVNWTNEEGSRFAPAMMASGVFAGKFSQEWAYAQADLEGKTFGEELERIGWRGKEPVGQRDIRAFFELHIEQGPILENEGVEIGVVTHGQGLIWQHITLTGRASHTGTTPMPLRRNAGLGLARVTELVHEIAMGHQPHAVGAIGHVEVYPNSRNVIPDKTVFTVDFRSPDKSILEDMHIRLRTETEKICAELGLEVAWGNMDGFDPVEFDRECVAAVRNATERLGYTHRDIVSGAGHDACWINEVAPTAMVMCPCVGGLSHNEAEEITKEWAKAGAEVLLHAVVETAEIVT